MTAVSWHCRQHRMNYVELSCLASLPKLFAMCANLVGPHQHVNLVTLTMLVVFCHKLWK